MSNAETPGSSAAKTEPELPPLSPQEFRAYNRLAETMDYFVCQEPSLSIIIGPGGH